MAVDSKQRLKQFNVTGAAVLLAPMATLVAYAILSKTFNWSSTANGVALGATAAVEVTAFTVMVRRAAALMRTLPIRDAGSPFDPNSPSTTAAEIDHSERAGRMLRTRRGRLLAVYPATIIAGLAIASMILPPATAAKMMMFFGGFAVIGAERSLARIANIRKTWFDTAQYHPRSQKAFDAAMTILRGFILGTFGAYLIAMMTYDVMQSTAILLGGITGWFASHRFQLTFQKSIEDNQPEAITPR